MKVTVFGTGYVGLVTGTCLAEMGNHVVCLDLDARRIDGLNQGQMPIHEPGLPDVVLRNARSGSNSQSDAARQALDQADIGLGCGRPWAEILAWSAADAAARAAWPLAGAQNENGGPGAAVSVRQACEALTSRRASAC